MGLISVGIKLPCAKTIWRLKSIVPSRAISKKITVFITRSASVKNVTKKYAVKFAKLIAFLAIAPFVGGVIGFITKIVLIPIIVFFVLFIVLIVLGNKIIMK